MAYRPNIRGGVDINAQPFNPGMADPNDPSQIRGHGAADPLHQQNALLAALMGNAFHGGHAMQQPMQEEPKIDENYSGPMGIMPAHSRFGGGLYGGFGSLQGNSGQALNPFWMP